jgi:hypothetical protein
MRRIAWLCKHFFTILKCHLPIKKIQMNFLSHYYFDRYTTDPNLVVGIVLPDLVKNAKKDWNLHPEKPEYIYPDSDSIKSIRKGWGRHILVDKYFHSSNFFVEHTHKLKIALLPVLDNSPVRPSFLAHITLELLLDSLLITEEVLDANSFYDHLKNVEIADLGNFLSTNGLDDLPRFLNFFEEFINANYLHSYREPKSVVYALNRICLRLWDDPLSANTKEELKLVLIDYKAYLETVYMEIFEDISARLV